MQPSNAIKKDLICADEASARLLLKQYLLAYPQLQLLHE